MYEERNNSEFSCRFGLEAISYRSTERRLFQIGQKILLLRYLILLFFNMTQWFVD